MGIGIGPFPGVGNGSFFVNCLAVNACADTATCSFKVTVRDVRKPLALLKSSIAGNITPSGTVRFHARQLNQASSDNCTGTLQLRFAFSNNPADSIRVYDCSQLGQYPATVFVFDESGNFSQGNSQVQVLDGMGNCQMSAVEGQILTAEGLPLRNVRVTATGENYSESTLSDGLGKYGFEELFAGEACTVLPFKNEDPLNGVNSYDLKILYHHILGSQLLQSPYSIVAADINRNGKVTLNDLIELRSLILGEIDAFQSNTAWRFVPSTHTFPNPQNPFSPPFPEFFSSQELPAGNNKADFVAMKIGDLNGSAVPNFESPNAGEDRTDDFYVSLQVDNQFFRTGELVPVSIRCEQGMTDLSAFQFTLDFDRSLLEFQSLAPGELSGMGFDNIGASHVQDGALTVSWNEISNAQPTQHPLIMTATFLATADGQLSDALRFSSRITSAKAFDKNGHMHGLNLKFIGTPSASGGLKLLPNLPNPFFEMTMIRFVLPDDSDIKLRVYDLNGKMVHEKEGDYKSGDNLVVLQRKDIGLPGVYWYELETRFGVVARKLVMF